MINRLMIDVAFYKTIPQIDKHGSESLILEEYFKTKCTFSRRDSGGLRDAPFSKVIKSRMVIYIKEKHKEILEGDFAKIGGTMHLITRITNYSNHTELILERDDKANEC